MLQHVAVGVSLGFVAAIQPGPSQAYYLSRVAAVGWRRTLPAAFAPLVSDGPIALLVLLVLGQISPSLQNVLRGAGALLLFYFACRAFQQWRRGDPPSAGSSDPRPRTLVEAAMVNALNPNPYLGWALVLGPAVLAGWRESPGAGTGVLIAFYATLVSAQAGLIFVLGSMRLLGAGLHRTLLLLSGLILAGLASYQLVLCLRFLGRL